MRKLSGLRRRAVLTAAMAVVLAVFPVMVPVHLPEWLVILSIALEIILVGMAVAFLFRSRQSNRDAAAPRPVVALTVPPK